MEMKIRQRYTKDDSMFLAVELIIAVICLFIPLILYLVNDRILLDSISAYVDMNYSHIFGLLLTMASMLFIFNGALYFKVERNETAHPELIPDCVMPQTIYNKKRKGKWYNLILGIALLGVTIFHYDREFSKVLHYVFAVIFFLGSAIVIFFIHDPEDRWKSRVLAIGSIFCLAVAVYDESILSLFWAENVALIIIGIHYILESRRIWLRFE